MILMSFFGNKPKNKIYPLLIGMWCFLAISGTSLASLNKVSQLTKNPEKVAKVLRKTNNEQSEERKAPPNFNSPRWQFGQFLDALGSKNFDRAIEYLDLRHVRSSQRKEIGGQYLEQLKYILDRFYWFDEDSLSNSSTGRENDGLNLYRDLVTEISFKDGHFFLYLDRIGNRNSAKHWKVSQTSLKSLPEFYHLVRYGFWGKHVPDVFFEKLFFDLQLWQWPYLIGLVLLCLFIAPYLTKIGFQIFAPIGKKSYVKKNYEKLTSFATRPVALLNFLGMVFLGIQFVHFPPPFYLGLLDIFKTILLIAFVWLTFAFIDMLHFLLFDRLIPGKNVGLGHHSSTASQAKASFPLGKRTIKVLISMITLMILMQNWGINVTALFAGLGVGGIAVALAGQKTIENLFGGIILLTDRPIRIGDMCRFDNELGEVEEIGLRSTRIRTLNRSIITIPNGEFSQMKIENLYKRDCIRFYEIVKIDYTTSPDQIRFVLIELKKLLLEHPKVLEDPCRVRLIHFAEYCLEIEIHAYILSTSWGEFLGIKENILLKIMDLFKNNGISWALPSQNIQMKKASTYPSDLKEKVEQEMEQLRIKGELPLPDFTAQQQAELLNRMVYPEPCSSVYNQNSLQ